MSQGRFTLTRTNMHGISYWFYHFTIPLLYLVGISNVAGSAAAAITSEHEEDTWVSLTSTDLTGREIIFAKLWGLAAREQACRGDRLAGRGRRGRRRARRAQSFRS